jgi:hypothetical protein
MRDSKTEIAELREELARAWSRETSAEPERWTEANPAFGQCAVTALVVQDYLGGELLRAEVGPVSHYWNLLPSGDEVDLTRHQFGTDVALERVEPRTRDYVLSHPDTQRRYELLARRVGAHLREPLLARA